MLAATKMRSERGPSFSAVVGRMALTFEPDQGVEDRTRDVEALLHEILVARRH
jgi:hypothetical protein